MSRIGLRAGNGTVLNPLPSVTVGEVARKANIILTSPNKDTVQAFTVEYTYNMEGVDGNKPERLDLHPGESVDLPKSIAEQYARECADQGIVVVRPNESEDEARLRGLRNALNFYRKVGSESLAKKQAGMSQEEREAYRNRFAPLHMNKVKETLIEKEIARVEKALIAA